MKSFVGCILLFLFFQSSFAQPRKIAYTKSAVAVEKWDLIDLSFKVNRMPSGNPFDVVFGAVFTGPENANLDVPGFYNGNNEWVLRFSANKPGKWSFTTYSSSDRLTGQVGTVNVTENKDPNRKGAIMVDPKNPQYFIYEDDTPYFNLIYELDWLFALDYHNKQGLTRTSQIVQDIKDNGFNQIVMNVYAYEVRWHTDKTPPQYEYARPDNFIFKGTNANPDFSELNPDFFKHFDRVIHYLDREGIIAHVMIYVWNKNVNWPEMYSKADNMYFDYVINRYQAFTNIIWDVSKEALDYGRCDIPYINERISRIRKRDAYNRLVTVHDYEYCSREADKVDFISVQNWRPNLYDNMIQARKHHSDKPVVNIEHGGYEKGPFRSFPGNYTSPETCLIRNYECIFAGVYPSYYWQNTAWNIVIYDALDPKHDFDAPKYEYYKFMTEFFSRYNFNDLFPVAQKFTTNDKKGLDNLSTGGLPLTNGKDLFIYLIPEVVEKISTVLPAHEGNIDVTWFNPFTGEYKEVGNRPWGNWIDFTSPWNNTTSILIIKLI
jgi:hypothetical protein